MCAYQKPDFRKSKFDWKLHIYIHILTLFIILANVQINEIVFADQWSHTFSSVIFNYLYIHPKHNSSTNSSNAMLELTKLDWGYSLKTSPDDERLFNMNFS